MKEGRDLERILSPRLKNLKEKTQYRKAPKGERTDPGNSLESSWLWTRQ